MSAAVPERARRAMAKRWLEAAEKFFKIDKQINCAEPNCPPIQVHR
jgi:hypothetical protein